MLFAIVLAATAAASPAPSLTSLKTIVNVRSTPLCSALRTALVPSIAALLDNDATIEKAPPIFNAMYQHELTNAWRDGSPHFFLDQARLEALIGPLTENLKRIDALLNDTATFSKDAKSDDERILTDVRAKLKAVEAQQQKALNTISGYNATALTYDMIDENVPSTWQKVFSVSPKPQNPIGGSAHGAPAPTASQSPHAPNDPRYGSSPLGTSSSLSNDAYAPLAQYIQNIRTDAAAAESSAAKDIWPLATLCENK